MSRFLSLLVLCAAACNATPEGGEWVFEEVEWAESDCSDDFLSLMPLWDAGNTMVSTDSGFTFETYLGDVVCERAEEGGYVCAPLVLLEIDLRDGDEIEALATWSVTYAATFGGAGAGWFDVQVESVCEGEDCEMINAVSASLGQPLMCSASGTQRARLDRGPM